MYACPLSKEVNDLPSENTLSLEKKKNKNQPLKFFFVSALNFASIQYTRPIFLTT